MMNDLHKAHDCQAILTTISDYIDGELRDDLCAALEAHLRDCQNCQVVVNTLQKTVELYRHVSEDETLPGDVRRRLYACLDLGDYLLNEQSE